MCEVCGPRDGKPEKINPELMQKLRDHTDQMAKRRGMTTEEFLDADNLVSFGNRVKSWFEGFKLNLQLFRPGL